MIMDKGHQGPGSGQVYVDSALPALSMRNAVLVLASHVCTLSVLVRNILISS